MKKLFIVLIMLVSFSSNAKDFERNYCFKETSHIIKIVNQVESEVINLNDTQKNDIEVCRVCCTISVPSGLGGMVGVTACSGDLFTSCETAGHDACVKAGKKAFDMVMGL